MKRNYTLCMGNETYEKLKEYCKDNNVKIGRYIEKVVKDSLERKPDISQQERIKTANEIYRLLQLIVYSGTTKNKQDIQWTEEC